LKKISGIKTGSQLADMSVIFSSAQVTTLLHFLHNCKVDNFKMFLYILMIKFFRFWFLAGVNVNKHLFMNFLANQISGLIFFPEKLINSTHPAS